MNSDRPLKPADRIFCWCPWGYQTGIIWAGPDPLGNYYIRWDNETFDGPEDNRVSMGMESWEAGIERISD